MADLLNDEDWAEFDEAIGDVVDTFFNIDVTIIQYNRNFSNYYGDEKNDVNDKVETVIKGLSIFDKDGKALNERLSMGEMDLSEGYVLMYWHDLNDAGLISPTTQKPLINSTVDEIKFQDDVFTLIGDAQVGPFEDRFALIKLFFKRKMKNG